MPAAVLEATLENLKKAAAAESTPDPE